MTGPDQGVGSDNGFTPNGREPELQGSDHSLAPMLGGSRRLWPSVAAYLLSEQHKAHRDWDMHRVWVMRRLRYRLERRLDLEREASLYTGDDVRSITDDMALSEIIEERNEVREAMEQALSWQRVAQANEQRDVLTIVDEVISIWQPKLGTEWLDSNGQNQ